MIRCRQCHKPERPLRRQLCHACYEQLRRAGRVQSLVDPTPAIWHISQLRFMGMGTRTIAELADVDRSAVAKITKYGPARYVNSRTVDAICSVPIPSQRVCFGRWHPRPRRRQPVGVRVGDLWVCCGDCEHYPCRCPRVDDWDVPVLGRFEGGGPQPRVLWQAAS